MDLFMNKKAIFCSSLVFILIVNFYFSLASGKEIQGQSFEHISYIEQGRGQPLVLIHAFPTEQKLWMPQQEELKKYFRVITLDLWGFGHSSRTDGQAVTMAIFAEEVKRLLDQLHIHKAIIGGESMGGYVALAFLKQYPERVEGLILSATQSIADSEEAKKKRELTAKTVLEQGSTQFINDFMPKALSPNATVQVRDFLRSILESQAVTGIASALRGMALREDTSRVLAATMLPVLIITGEKDMLISPKQSQDMHELAKNSKLVIIANAGHLSSLEQSEQWNLAVLDFFVTNA